MTQVLSVALSVAAVFLLVRLLSTPLRWFWKLCINTLCGAAMTMGMAYSKAWTIVKQAERELGFPLLVSVTGGRHGGGAELSPKAERLLAAYGDYCARMRAFAAEEFGRAFAEFTEEPQAESE